MIHPLSVRPKSNLFHLHWGRLLEPRGRLRGGVREAELPTLVPPHREHLAGRPSPVVGVGEREKDLQSFKIQSEFNIKHVHCRVHQIAHTCMHETVTTSRFQSSRKPYNCRTRSGATRTSVCSAPAATSKFRSVLPKIWDNGERKRRGKRGKETGQKPAQFLFPNGYTPI